ncbi:MAG TPA: hypothetical protein VK503_06195 [Candidatus Bathyarchaeia archaeon]|nr:hypothetical protein [Candidatus Bathyarchaeia archaeon]
MIRIGGATRMRTIEQAGIVKGKIPMLAATKMRSIEQSDIVRRKIPIQKPGASLFNRERTIGWI